MPCDSVRTSRVQWAQNTDIDLLAQALEQLGYTVRKDGKFLSFRGPAVNGTFDNGQMEITTGWDTEFDHAALKRAYSEQVVTAEYERGGWQVSWSTNEETGLREAVAERRAF